jgi:hypothetical protein
MFTTTVCDHCLRPLFAITLLIEEQKIATSTAADEAQKITGEALLSVRLFQLSFLDLPYSHVLDMYPQIVSLTNEVDEYMNWRRCA